MSLKDNMPKENNLKRFIDSQEADYQIALSEVKNGRKQSHWMWYIFPQIQGLGFSETSKFYAIIRNLGSFNSRAYQKKQTEHQKLTLKRHKKLENNILHKKINRVWLISN